MNNKQPRKDARQSSSRSDKQNDSRRGNTRNASGRRSHEHRGDNRHTAARRSSERRLGADYIEGRRACAEALKAGVPLKRALVATGDASLGSLVKQLSAAGIPVEEVSRDRLDVLSSHGAHQGIACQVAPYRYASLSDVIERAGDKDALVVVLDHVTDQGNLGAIVRSAEVVGAAGVIIPKVRAAGVGVGAYKTSAGAVMHIPVVQVANLPAVLDKLKEVGFWACAATEHAEDSVWSAPMGGRLALVMGSEGDGVSRLVMEHCDFGCKLPQRGHIESLNVAQAATVMCYEWLRRVSEAE
ncbi:23S rRNA (guanosine(2251)-2'-O)-methyltransferase RlmB [uncultured Olegusella sp.]|uniref:23S rRNA (guanosine(2251)-2'-O)-methyltransferase RlmB n=1 Tax=uncultured Olegusella sp. TaxID=1979846 RepID=UPI0026095C26|nr:23S rRNA (guanosine(2251)-2'-O)-methyltransferase RlmB [uncultured Olegusella sp.]